MSRPRQWHAVDLAGRLHRRAVMFELMSGGGAGRGRRAAWPVIVSTAAHAGAVTAASIIPLSYATDRLPEVRTMMALRRRAAASSSAGDEEGLVKDVPVLRSIP